MDNQIFHSIRTNLFSVVFREITKMSIFVKFMHLIRAKSKVEPPFSKHDAKKKFNYFKNHFKQKSMLSSFYVSFTSCDKFKFDCSVFDFSLFNRRNLELKKKKK